MEKSADAFRTISEVADLLETPAHVLRFWESRFPQIKPVKRAGGRRYYRPSDVALLSGIKRLLHDEGMTIRGVQRILREQGVRHVAGLTDDPSAEEEALEAAMLARLDVEDNGPRTTREIEAEQALALEAALEAPVASVVLPFRLPESVPDSVPDGVPVAEADMPPVPLPDVIADPAQELEPEREVQSESSADAAGHPKFATDPLPPPIVSDAPARGPALTLTTVVGATRAPSLPPAPSESVSTENAPPASAPPAGESDSQPAEVDPPIGNRLRALPRNAMAGRQTEARAALDRLKHLRDRLANPSVTPRN